MTLKVLQIALVTLALALVGPRPASAIGARVRWLASPDPRVVGYLVYVRSSGRPYDAPRNVGMPPRRTDGSLSFDVLGLASGDYVFAVSGYTDAAGQETPLSAEGRLGSPPAACLVDQCSSPQTCQIGLAADGTSCGDLNAPVGSCGEVCLAGRCAATTASALHTTQVKFQALLGAVRVTLRGHLMDQTMPSPVDSGLSFTLRTPSDAPLLDVAIPGAAFRTVGAGSMVSLEHVPVDVPPYVVERLVLRRLADGWSVRAKIRADGWGSAPTGVEAPALWGVQVADHCARDPGLVCAGTLHRVTCQ